MAMKTQRSESTVRIQKMTADKVRTTGLAGARAGVRFAENLGDTLLKAGVIMREQEADRAAESTVLERAVVDHHFTVNGEVIPYRDEQGVLAPNRPGPSLSVFDRRYSAAMDKRYYNAVEERFDVFLRDVTTGQVEGVNHRDLHQVSEAIQGYRGSLQNSVPKERLGAVLDTYDVHADQYFGPLQKSIAEYEWKQHGEDIERRLANNLTSIQNHVATGGVLFTFADGVEKLSVGLDAEWRAFFDNMAEAVRSGHKTMQQAQDATRQLGSVIAFSTMQSRYDRLVGMGEKGKVEAARMGAEIVSGDFIFQYPVMDENGDTQVIKGRLGDMTSPEERTSLGKLLDSYTDTRFAVHDADVKLQRQNLYSAYAQAQIYFNQAVITNDPTLREMGNAIINNVAMENVYEVNHDVIASMRQAEAVAYRMEVNNQAKLFEQDLLIEPFEDQLNLITKFLEEDGAFANTAKGLGMDDLVKNLNDMNARELSPEALKVAQTQLNKVMTLYRSLNSGSTTKQQRNAEELRRTFADSKNQVFRSNMNSTAVRGMVETGMVASAPGSGFPTVDGRMAWEKMTPDQITALTSKFPQSSLPQSLFNELGSRLARGIHGEDGMTPDMAKITEARMLFDHYRTQPTLRNNLRSEMGEREYDALLYLSEHGGLYRGDEQSSPAFDDLRAIMNGEKRTALSDGAGIIAENKKNGWLTQFMVKNGIPPTMRSPFEDEVKRVLGRTGSIDSLSEISENVLSQFSKGPHYGKQSTAFMMSPGNQVATAGHIVQRPPWAHPWTVRNMDGQKILAPGLVGEEFFVDYMKKLFKDEAEIAMSDTGPGEWVRFPQIAKEYAPVFAGVFAAEGLHDKPKARAVEKFFSELELGENAAVVYSGDRPIDGQPMYHLRYRNREGTWVDLTDEAGGRYQIDFGPAVQARHESDIREEERALHIQDVRQWKRRKYGPGGRSTHVTDTDIAEYEAEMSQ